MPEETPGTPGFEGGHIVKGKILETYVLSALIRVMLFEKNSELGEKRPFAFTSLLGFRWLHVVLSLVCSRGTWMRPLIDDGQEAILSQTNTLRLMVVLEQDSSVLTHLQIYQCTKGLPTALGPGVVCTVCSRHTTGADLPQADSRAMRGHRSYSEPFTSAWSCSPRKGRTARS